MKIEQQVVSLELAKRLKELGVKQESIYYWRSCSNNTRPEPENWYYSHRVVTSDEPVPEHFNNARLRVVSAFTCSELGEMLPKNIQGRLGMMFLEIYPNAVQNTWYCGYQRVDDAIREEADSEANARAKMLIYLLENKLINTPSQ